MTSAVEHRMEGLLWSGVRDLPDVGSPAWRRSVVVNDMVNRRRSEANWRGLGEAVALATSIDIELGTVKGVTAEARWYGRVGERPSGDVDLVLAPSDTNRAAELVSLIQPRHPLLPEIQGLVDTGLLQSLELRDARGVALDLHFDLLKLGMPCREPELLWTHMIRYEGHRDISVRVPDTELALLHLLLHLTKDRFRYLLGFVDIQRIVAGGPIDWDLFVALADAEGLRTEAYLALDAVSSVLPIEVDLDAFAGSRGSSLVWRYLWRPSTRLRGHEGVRRYRRRQDLLPMLAHGRTREAFSYWVRRRALPPRVLLLHSDVARGPYWWRVTGGRVGAALRRRRGVNRHQ